MRRSTEWKIAFTISGKSLILLEGTDQPIVQCYHISPTIYQAFSTFVQGQTFDIKT